MFNKILITVISVFVFFTYTQAQDIDDKLKDAKMAMMEGHFKSGLKICLDLIESGNADSTQLAEACASAGFANEALGNTPDALKYYSKAVEFKIPRLEIYDKLISLSKSQKNDSIYNFAIQEKCKEFPEFEKSITKSLANQYVNTKQYEKLLSTTNKLLTWYPDEIKYIYFKAVALQNLNKVEEAKGIYNKVLKLDPNHPGANMSLGMILYKEGSEIFANRKKEYESKAKPSRVDYSVYNKGIEAGKIIYRKALPHLLKAYESGSYPGLKQVIFNTYARLEQKDKAESYR